jgi:hypothetical protein
MLDNGVLACSNLSDIRLNAGLPSQKRHSLPWGGPREELAMRRIIEANIKRLKEMLKVETDPTKRAMEERLLAEEEEKLKDVKPGDRKAF